MAGAEVAQAGGSVETNRHGHRPRAVLWTAVALLLVVGGLLLTWRERSGPQDERRPFELVQRHWLVVGDNEPQCSITELSTLQRQILKILGLSPADYGR